MSSTATREGAARVSFRAAPATINEEARSVTATLATENPVQVFDYFGWEPVDERLMMDGVELPTSRQIPLLDSHNRARVRDQIGSIRNLRVEDGEAGSELVGDLHFDDGPEGEDAFRKVRAGHMRDMSVGFEIGERVRVPEGEKVVRGDREFEGPLHLITRWPILEASLTPIGADQAAKIRKRNSDMSKQASGAEGAKNNPAPPPAAPAQHPAPVQVEPTAEQRNAIAQEVQRDLLARQAEVRASGAKWVSGPFALPQSEVDAAIDGGLTAEAAGQRWIKWVEDNQGNPPASPASGRGAFDGDGARGFADASAHGDEKQEMIEAMAASIILRANPALEPKLHEGARKYARFKTLDLVRELARSRGKKIDGFATNEDIMRAAGGGSYGQRAPAMVGQDSAPNLLENVLNKSLGMGFREAPVTWPMFCRRMMASNLRDHPIPKMSQLASLAEVGEQGEVKLAGFSDKKERVRLSTWSRRLAITDEMVINDDLGFLADLPMKMGAAAARTVEELVYYRLLSNPTMIEDSTALFHSDHNNYVASSSGAAPGESTLNAAMSAMELQKDPSGKLLDLRPRFLIHPPALGSTVNKQLNSEWLPGAANETRNPFFGAFEPIRAPRLQDGVTVDFKDGKQTVAGNSTGWYLFADPSQIETLIVAFYGSDAPETVEERPIDVLGTDRRITLRFGADFGDWRGCYFNYGA